MVVKIKKLHKNAVIPKQATEFAGGWDVVATEIMQDSPDFVVCLLGFSLEVPKGYKVTLVPRSSLTKTHWILQNSPGLGDPDFRGQYQYKFRAIPDYFDTEIWYEDGTGHSNRFCYEDFPYKVGDRIGQIYIEEIIPIEFEEVQELSNTIRGEGGFGSSGS